MNERKDVGYDDATQKQFQVQQLRKEAGLKDGKPNSKADEEYAAEFAAPVPMQAKKTAYAIHPQVHHDEPADESATEERDAHEEVSAAFRPKSRALGYAAIIFAIASLFIWPVVLGGAAAVLGFFAFMRGTRGLGTWSMVLGLIAIAAYYLLIPYNA